MVPRRLAALIRNAFKPKRSSRPVRGALRLEQLEIRDLLTTISVEAPAWWSENESDITEETQVVTISGAELGGEIRTFRVEFRPWGWVQLYEALGETTTSQVALPIYPAASVPPPPAPNVPDVGLPDANTQEPPAPPSPPPRTVIQLELPDRPSPAKPETTQDTPRPDTPPSPPTVASRTPTVNLPPAQQEAPREVTLISTQAPARNEPTPAADTVRTPTNPDAPRSIQTTSTPAIEAGSLQTRDTPTTPPHTLTALTDIALARRFAAKQEQAAFTELVRRHGRSVQAVCASVLGDADRAQDASQATFVALARRAAALEDRGSLGGWLYRVAYRVALRYRATTARQRRAEWIAAERRSQEEDDDFTGVEDADLWRALREELARLPEKYRLPLTLHYLNGRTHAETAAEIGIPRGSVAKRICAGLERLRENLASRGVMIG